MEQPPPREPSGAQFCAAAALVGACAGAAVSLLDAVLVPGAHPASGRVAALVLDAVLWSVAFLGAAAIGSAALKRARPLALAIVALTGAALTAFHLAALVLRLLGGAYASVDAIAFAVEGGAHLAHTAWQGYTRYVVEALAGAIAVGAGAAIVLARAVKRPASARGATQGLAAAVSAPLVAFVALLGFAPARAFAASARATSPELALLASLGASFAPGEPVLPPIPGVEGDDATSVTLAPVPAPGPPRLAEDAFHAALAAPHGHRPNVVLVTLESISIAHLGYLGYPRAVTPNLDRIAKASLRMRRAWTTSTHSNYAQMAILSSLFPRRSTGLDQYDRLDYPRELFHDLFHEAGYATATISSQNEGWQGMRRFEDTGTPTHFVSADDWNGPTVDIGSERVVPDEITVDRAIEWMGKQHGKRFALYVNLQETHFPYALPKGAETPYSPNEPQGTFNYLHWDPADRAAAENRYDDALHYVDQQIGRLERFLAHTGLLEDTLLVVTADHGEMFGDHGTVTHGKTLFEGESRVPLLFHWPGHVHSGDVDEPVSHLDVLPTIADLVGLPKHPSFQGTSFADLAAHQRARTAVFLNDQGLRLVEGVVCWPWKLVNDRAAGTVRLYELEDDPEETEDRSASDPVVARALAEVLSAQMSAQMDYHREDDADARRARFAPRLLRCPEVTTAPSRVGHR